MKRLSILLLCLGLLGLGCRQRIEHVVADPETPRSAEASGMGGYDLERLDEALDVAKPAALADADLAEVEELVPALPPGFSFVVEGASGPAVVLALRVDPSLAVGPFELTTSTGAGPFLLRRGISEDSTPSSLDRRFVLHDAGGEVCVARVSEAALLVRATPPYDLWAGFQGEDEYPPVDEEQMAQALWDLARHDGMLVADVVEADGDCEGALWARPVEEPEPTVYADEGRVTGGVALEATGAFRALPEYAALARDFASYHDAGGAWDESEGTGVEVRRFVDGPRSLLAVSATAGYGCGDFNGSLFAIFERNAQGNLVARATGDFDRPPVAILDLESDGELEVLFRDMLALDVEEEPVFIDVEVPYFGCSC